MKSAKDAKAGATPGNKASATPAGSGRRQGTNRRMGESTAQAAPALAPGESFYRRWDWLAFGVVALIVLIGYLITLAPDVTLEDSGEMAVAAQYAGVPHAPGYPAWTLYAWLFAKLLPFSNIAWRVAVGSAVAGALACGFVALIVSRGANQLLRAHLWVDQLNDRRRNLFGVAGGVAAGTALGFSGFVWSQAVIVEVYTLSLLSLTGMMACLFRWMHAPLQRRYLFLVWFLFGLCLSNHQSLVVAALAIEVCVIFADPRLGRDLLLGNVLCYFVGLYGVHRGWILDNNGPLLACYNAIGIGSIAGLLWLSLKTRGLGQQFGWALTCGVLFLGGVAFYLWMPITSMSNPPLNWAYPRTAAGFFHALTRGQYESPHPVTSLGRYVEQLWHLGASAVDEFSVWMLLLGLIPLILLRVLRGAERGWLIGGLAFYLVLGPGLLVLLNPGTDRATQSLVRVFFGASHVMIAISIGLGLAFSLGLVAQEAAQRTRFLWAAGGVWIVSQVGGVLVTWSGTELSATRWAAGLGLGLATLGMILLVLRKHKWTPMMLAGLVMIVPLPSAWEHWWTNEQRGHLFGYWFGHDMFSPPFRAANGTLSYDQKERAHQLDQPKGASIYPEMAKDAVLFGGTDPGRFCPTYMIFSESFLPAAKRRIPEFDRRDVYLITQNALADAHYLEYIRAHYNRSAQEDPYFFSELLRGKTERQENYSTNLLARMALPMDRMLTKIGANIEQERRAAGVYPRKELKLPSNQDLELAMQDFMRDFQVRAQKGQLRPGEEVRVNGNQAQVSGPAAVMGINAILTRQIFEQNPGHEFYVEESFPLDWMYPYLSPYGTIMKLERSAPKELDQDVVERDRKFWGDYLERLMGNWVKLDTNISEICEFADRVHRRQDLSKYRGDWKFIRDDQAQKAFSKLRSSIGGVYDWRFRNATGQLQVVSQQLAQSGLNPQQIETLHQEQRRLTAEQLRMYQEAELAYKQAYALCPVSPEALQRLVSLLVSVGRVADAAAIADVSLKLDPGNEYYTNLATQLRRMQTTTS